MCSHVVVICVVLVVVVVVVVVAATDDDVDDVDAAAVVVFRSATFILRYSTALTLLSCLYNHHPSPHPSSCRCSARKS